MEVVMEIISGIGAINSAIGVIKSLNKIGKDYDAASLKIQLADVLSALADIKIAHTEMIEENSDLKKEISRLIEFKNELSISASIDGYSFHFDEKGEPSQFPLCPSCLVKSGRAVQIFPQNTYHDGKCPMCDSIFSGLPYHTQDGQFVSGKFKSYVTVV